MMPVATVELPCRCGNKFVVDVPPHEVMNSQLISAVVFTHEELPVCPFCGQAYQFQVRTLKGVEYGWVPVAAVKEQRKVILPPGGLDLGRKQ